MARAALFCLVLAAAGAAAAVFSRAPEALARMDFFRVEEVRLEGARFLLVPEAVAAAGIPDDASVWGDTERWASRLREHSLVSEARIRRRLPSTLVLEVVERVPVALLPMPTLEPVDRTGAMLPIDPTRHPLDLPLLRPRTWGDEERPLFPGEIRMLSEEAGRLAEAEPAFLATLSELAWEPGGGIVARGGRNGVLVRFRPPLSSRRIQEAVAVLADAAGRLSRDDHVVVDLRYAEQVVVRSSRAPVSASIPADS